MNRSSPPAADVDGSDFQTTNDKTDATTPTAAASLEGFSVVPHSLRAVGNSWEVRRARARLENADSHIVEINRGHAVLKDREPDHSWLACDRLVERIERSDRPAAGSHLCSAEGEEQ